MHGKAAGLAGDAAHCGALVSALLAVMTSARRYLWQRHDLKISVVTQHRAAACIMSQLLTCQAA